MYILVNRDSGVRLSEADGGYKQFWKQICLFGEYVNPNGGAHPNCSCVERFGVEEDEVGKEPEVYSDIRKLIENSTPGAGDITERDGAKPKPHEKSVVNIIHSTICDYNCSVIVNLMREYGRKSQENSA